MPIRPVRRPRRPSRLATGLVALGVSIVGATISVLLFAGPASPRELAPFIAVVAALHLLWWSVQAVWERMTRERRRYRDSG